MKIENVMREKLAQKCWEVSLPNKLAYPITVYFCILEIIQNMMLNFGVSFVPIDLILLTLYGILGLKSVFATNYM